MKRKQWLYLVTALALLFVLAGCGGGGTENAAPESVPEAESADADNEPEAATPDQLREADSETLDVENAETPET